MLELALYITEEFLVINKELLQNAEQDDNNNDINMINNELINNSNNSTNICCIADATRTIAPHIISNTNSNTNYIISTSPIISSFPNISMSPNKPPTIITSNNTKIHYHRS